MSQSLTNPVVIVPGSNRVDLRALRSLAREFGWGIEVAADICEVAAAQKRWKPVALLFFSDSLGPGYSWVETIRLLRRTLPGVRLVACHGFSEPLDWPELSEAGAFHSLRLPLTENELRQGFGFIWEAEQRLAAANQTTAPGQYIELHARLSPSAETDVAYSTNISVISLPSWRTHSRKEVGRTPRSAVVARKQAWSIVLTNSPGAREGRLLSALVLTGNDIRAETSLQTGVSIGAGSGARYSVLRKTAKTIRTLRLAIQ